MTTIEKLREIAKVLGIDLSKEIKLEQAVLDDGSTVIEAEKWEQGYEVFIVTDEERIPLPQGEYNLDNGATLSVVEDGIIAEVILPGDEQQEAPVDEEQEMEAEKPKKVVESKTKETHFNEDEVLEVKFTEAHEKELKALFTKWYNELKEYVKEEMEQEEVKEELSVQPKKHSPEKEVKKEFKFKIAANRKGGSVQERINARLFANN